MAHEVAALSVGVCNALIENLLVADSPDGVSLEMRVKSTSYRDPGQDGGPRRGCLQYIADCDTI